MVYVTNFLSQLVFSSPICRVSYVVIDVLIKVYSSQVGLVYQYGLMRSPSCPFSFEKYLCLRVKFSSTILVEFFYTSGLGCITCILTWHSSKNPTVLKNIHRGVKLNSYAGRGPHFYIVYTWSRILQKFKFNTGKVTWDG